MLAFHMRHDATRHGDLVQVRSPAEILATLDERGMLGGLPFMPEMLRYCGRRLVVDKRAEKICDTIYPLGSRRIPDGLLLGNLRCDGGAHDGCQADCRLFWKDAWLRPDSLSEPSTATADDDIALQRLTELATANTNFQTTNAAGQTVTRYRCQNTELHRASEPVRTFDPRAYWRVYKSGNVGLFRFLRVICRAVIEEPMRKLKLTPRIVVRGSTSGSERATPLNLQPGDLVRVKSKEEIVATLDAEGRNRGLFFDREMLPYCGGTYRVRKRVTRFIDDRKGGEMIELKSDCVTMEGVICSGELSPVRWFCPRGIQSFWRDIWLTRVDAPSVEAPQQGVAPESLPHRPGTAQLDNV
jgi:hypothetical protein